MMAPEDAHGRHMAPSASFARLAAAEIQPPAFSSTGVDSPVPRKTIIVTASLSPTATQTLISRGRQAL